MYTQLTRNLPVTYPKLTRNLPDHLAQAHWTDVLEENAASAIDFEWECYSPNKNIYEQCTCCVSPIISSAVQSRDFV